jgi:short-subunit dehydrogenase
MGPFKDLTGHEIESLVTINALHPIYLVKSLLKQILSRNARSAIVITSSGLGSAPIPGILPYSCAKSFSSFLGEGLNIELKDKVDVLSFQCGEVATKMLGKSRRGISVITP